MHELPREDPEPSEITPYAGPERQFTEREFTVKARTQTQLVVRRFLQHKLAVVSLFVLIAVVLLAFVGGPLWHYSYTTITPDNNVPPSTTHPFGTDNLGYDEFARVLRGTQRSLEIAFSVAVLATLIGTIWGAVAGYYRGWLDTLMMRIADLFLTIPILAAGALLSHHFQSAGWWALALVIAGLAWPAVARIVRGQTLSLREKEYVEAGRSMGAKDGRIIFRHILPNVVGQIIVVVTIQIAFAILLESSLSYLGFGVQPPDTSLGTLISTSQTALQGGQWWLFYFPGIMIILISLSVNFIGDGLRDAFDPSQQRVRA
jgi:peptide/nickel transport system permease protein